MAGMAVSKTRVLVETNSGKLIVGRDWLIALRYQIKQRLERDECQGSSPVNHCDKTITNVNPKKAQPQNSATKHRISKIVQQKRVSKNITENRNESKGENDTTQQKGRRIPIQLQNQIDAGIFYFIKERHFKKLAKKLDNVFVQPTVKTVKSDVCKIALDAQALKELIAKHKYQMPNIYDLIDMIAEKLDEEGQTWCSSVDLTYVFDVSVQTSTVNELTKEHCNFQIVWGNSQAYIA